MIKRDLRNGENCRKFGLKGTLYEISLKSLSIKRMRKFHGECKEGF